MKIFIPAQPAPEVIRRPNTSGKGDAEWVNTNFQFQKVENGDVLLGQLQFGDHAALIMSNVGKSIEVEDESKYLDSIKRWVMRIPRKAGATGWRGGSGGGGSREVSYTGPKLTKVQYFGLVSEAYRQFSLDCLVVAMGSATEGTIVPEKIKDRVMETAQQLVLQYVIAIQKNMVETGIKGPPANPQATPATHVAQPQTVAQPTVTLSHPDLANVAPNATATPLTQSVSTAFLKIRQVTLSKGGTLPAELANSFADRVREKADLTPEERRQIAEFIVAAQQGKLKEGV